MIKVNDILHFLETLAPEYMREDWDHVGLNCGHADREVHRILVALDPFEDVCKEAKQLGADLLVTHHALIWNPQFVNDLNQQGRNTLFLIENNIACINAHTNLDCAPGGVNDILAESLGLEDIRVVAPKGVDNQGREWGLLRQGCVRKQSLPDFLATVKKNLHCEGLRYTDAGRSVQRVAVGGGSCAGEMVQAVAAGCDTFVTADVKYNQFWDAQSLGLNLIDAGHFHTENPVCRYLTDKLREQFPEITVTMSLRHADCAKFFY